jgi:TRAP-type C4-dicarboxylate transport system permease small subunit
MVEARAAIAVDLAGNIICTAGAVWLIWYTWRKVSRRTVAA